MYKQYIYLCMEQNKRIPFLYELILFLKFKYKFSKMVGNMERYNYVWSRGKECLTQWKLDIFSCLNIYWCEWRYERRVRVLYMCYMHLAYVYCKFITHVYIGKFKKEISCWIPLSHNRNTHVLSYVVFY